MILLFKKLRECPEDMISKQQYQASNPGQSDSSA